MVLPAIIILFIFNYVPIYGVLLAFKNYNPNLGIIGSKFIGMIHFKTLFEDPYFIKVIGNTLKISALRFVWGFPVPILLALMLNEVKKMWFKKTVQTVSYLPHFISWVIVSGILLDICSIDGGVVNQIIQFLGGKPVSFFGDSNNFITMIIASGIWKAAGWGTIIYFAAIANINPELYEAAEVDGAKRLQKIWFITMPGLVPAISISLIFTCSGFLNAGFDQIFNLYNEVVYESADIIDTYIYRIGITDGNYGVSTALGLFNSVLSLILLLSANKLIKKLGGDGIW
jgi:putative aldouronate transport system permease protein